MSTNFEKTRKRLLGVESVGLGPLSHKDAVAVAISFHLLINEDCVLNLGA